MSVQENCLKILLLLFFFTVIELRSPWQPTPVFLPGESPWTEEPGGVSLVAQMVKNLCAMQETQVQSLGQEDPLVKEMATHSSILAWRIPWTEESDRLQSMGSKRAGHD